MKQKRTQENRDIESAEKASSFLYLAIFCRRDELVINFQPFERFTKLTVRNPQGPCLRLLASVPIRYGIINYRFYHSIHCTIMNNPSKGEVLLREAASFWIIFLNFLFLLCHSMTAVHCFALEGTNGRQDNRAERNEKKMGWKNSKPLTLLRTGRKKKNSYSLLWKLLANGVKRW